MEAPSTAPEFWNPRYASGTTPWDLGRVPPALGRYLAAHPGRGARVLIPGCGSGYEVEAFAAAGYDVTAIDFSPPAVARARARLPAALVERVIEGDFFAYDFSAAPFELIYERTFLCALPPELWTRIIDRAATLLADGGVLAGLYFFGEKGDGPPFGLDPGEPEKLFSKRFTLVDDRSVPAGESLPLFVHRERWQERRKVR